MRSLFDSLVSRIAPLLAAASLLPALAAQCELTWQPFSPLAGADSRVTCLATLPSGDLVAGGWFEAIGSIPSKYIARWDGTAWSPLGAGPGSWLPPGGGVVTALLALPNGDLLASGAFGVERWNGTAWTLLGTGYTNVVLALCRLPNGDIVAGGSFQFLAGQPLRRLARWNGTAWSALGSGVDNGEVRALAVLPNGDVAIGGTFSSIGGTPMRALAVWNGTNFAPLGLTGGVVHALQALPTGELLIGAGGLPATLLRWNGTTPVAVTPPLTGPVTSLRVEANGDWIVGGTNLFQSMPSVNLVRYSSGARTVLSGTADTVFALGEHNNRLVAGRGPNANIELIDPTIESFDGVAWTPLGAPANALVDVLLADRAGGLCAGGRFTTIAGVPANNIARWDGAAWSALGAGVDGAVTHLELTSDGDVIAAGQFTHAGGVLVNGMARWDGATWTSLQNTQGPTSFACGPFGEIVTMQVDGTVRVLTAGQWTTLPPVPVQPCTDVVVTGNGTIVVSCMSSSPPVPAMLWNGLAWQPMGTGLFTGNQIALDSSGKVMLVGAYYASGTPSGFMAQSVLDWNGSQWVQRTDELHGGISDVLALRDGDLMLIGG
ncbi:MAG TPA: hypothetical protein VFT55_04870, partial [Planctomycetota bacterium]|nr:hypothetical protein [Planctomycetota bacterium]